MLLGLNDAQPNTGIRSRIEEKSVGASRRDVGTSLEPFGNTFKAAGASVRKNGELSQAVKWWAHKDSNLGPAD
jgi:hypothetical protein